MTATRISLVLSGGASLGAYQAGAVAGLLVTLAALREAGEDVAIDSLGGASAGAFVAFLAAHGLLTGRDPVALLHGAWVERVDLELLLGGSDAPLTFDRLRDRVTDVLEPDGDERRVPPQDRPIVLHVALTGLRGLRYPVRALRGDREVLATTYVDWAQYQLEPGDPIDALVQRNGSGPLDAVLASASNPGGFAPVLLDRRSERDAYATHGMVDFPDHGQLWYSDGGLLQTEPVGRVIDAARGLPHGDDGERLALLIDPRSEGPSGGRRFADPDERHGWIDGLARALSIIPAQALYDDLRRVERDNARLTMLERLVDEVGPHLDRDTAANLTTLLDDYLDDELGGAPDRPRLEDADAASAFRAVVAEIAGLTGKEHVAVDVLSPLLLADGEVGVPALIAGEVLADFGGFLSRELRHSDFTLGYATTRRWLDHGLPWIGVDPAAAEAARRAVDERRIAPWEAANRGRATLSDVSWSSRLAVARFAARAVTTMLRGLTPAPPGGLVNGIRRTARKVGHRLSGG